AQLCFSCHIGNTTDKKFVTHEMYAVGHPPLPGIELDTFSDSLPRHWRYLADKPPGVFESDEMQKTYGRSLIRLERVQIVVVGGLVALREAVKLAQDTAGQGGADYAQFDCFACHHDLSQPNRDKPSARSFGGYRARPGRPIPRSW